MLIRTNMEDMREKTHTRHYELYRQKRLEQMGFTDVDSENKPVSFQQTFEAKRSNHLAELQAKEDEVRQMFVVRVKEKEAELKDSEKEVSFYTIFILHLLMDYFVNFSCMPNLRNSRKITLKINASWKKHVKSSRMSLLSSIVANLNWPPHIL